MTSAARVSAGRAVGGTARVNLNWSTGAPPPPPAPSGGFFSKLKAAAEELDHGLLNDKPGLELPSLEKLCLWFAGKLKPEWPGLCRVTVGRPTVHERCTLSL